MPLDPIIANPASIKLDDPLEQYTNYLRASAYKGEADKSRRAEENTRVLNALYKKHTDANGVTNFNALMGDAAANNIGTVIPGIQDERQKWAKGNADIDKTNADASKTNAEAFDKAMGNFRQQLTGISTDPKVGVPQLVEWTKQQFNDPVLGPVLRQHGKTPEAAVAQLMNTLKSMPYDQFLLQNQIGAEAASKNHIEQVDLGGHKQLVQTKEHGNANPTLLSDQQVTLSPNHPRGTSLTINNIPAQVESAYGKEFAALMAKEDIGLYQAAQKAPQLAQRADRIMQLLDNDKVITGPAATQRAQIAQVLGLKGAAETQVLAAELARTTLDSIRTSGLGGGNGFTDNDRKFLEKAVGGQIDLDKNALRELTRLNRQAAQNSVNSWNTRVQQIKSSATSGTGTPTAPIQLPTPPATQSGWPTPPAANIARLRANPHERAIFEKHYGPGSADRYLGKQ